MRANLILNIGAKHSDFKLLSTIGVEIDIKGRKMLEIA